MKSWLPTFPYIIRSSEPTSHLTVIRPRLRRRWWLSLGLEDSVTYVLSRSPKSPLSEWVPGLFEYVFDYMFVWVESEALSSYTHKKLCLGSGRQIFLSLESGWQMNNLASIPDSVNHLLGDLKPQCVPESAFCIDRRLDRIYGPHCPSWI